MIRCMHPTKASGATPIGSTGRAPDKITGKRGSCIYFCQEEDMQTKDKCFEPMLKYKYLTIASGATPIGSTGRAPDENSGRKKNGEKE